MKTKQNETTTAKNTKCHHCGEKGAKFRRFDCGTWGRKIYLCDECAANGK